jgi:hypothetical protein
MKSTWKIINDKGKTKRGKGIHSIMVDNKVILKGKGKGKGKDIPVTGRGGP